MIPANEKDPGEVGAFIALIPHPAGGRPLPL